MMDTHTNDLLAATEEALRPPTNGPRSGRWHSRTLRHRLPLVREALRVAHGEGDIERATRLIDQAVADHPAARRSARFWTGAPLRSRSNPRHQHSLLVWFRHRRWV